MGACFYNLIGISFIPFHLKFIFLHAEKRTFESVVMQWHFWFASNSIGDTITLDTKERSLVKVWENSHQSDIEPRPPRHTYILFRKAGNYGSYVIKGGCFGITTQHT